MNRKTYEQPSLKAYGPLNRITGATDTGGGGDTFNFTTSNGGLIGQTDVGTFNEIEGDCTWRNGSDGTATQTTGHPCDPADIGWDGTNITGQEDFLDRVFNP